MKINIYFIFISLNIDKEQRSKFNFIITKTQNFRILFLK